MGLFGRSEREKHAEARLRKVIVHWNSLVGYRVLHKGLKLGGTIVGLCDYDKCEQRIIEKFYYNLDNVEVPVKWDTGVVETVEAGVLEVLEKEDYDG